MDIRCCDSLLLVKDWARDGLEETEILYTKIQNKKK